jgi:hypothetical protein
LIGGAILIDWTSYTQFWKDLKETERKWTLDAGTVRRFFYFWLCIAETAVEDLKSSRAQFADFIA